MECGVLLSPLPIVGCRKRSSSVVTSCCYGGLKVPLEATTAPGRLLTSVFLNDKNRFHSAVHSQLEQLALHRDPINLCSESLLHRRIAELKELECRNGLEEVMYMLIVYKFSEIGVHLIPRLSKCVYNGRFEIWPSRDWELESIHGSEVLELVKEHLTSVIGWKEKSNVTENWTPTQVQRLQLCRVYAASILFGYFLKSVSLRHRLEQCLDQLTSSNLGNTTPINLLPLEPWSLKRNTAPFGPAGGTSGGQISLVHEKKLGSYVMGFDHDTVEMCAKPKFKVTLNLIEKHCCALFGDEKTGPPEKGVLISTSLASLKRIVLEAVAFGSFLWDTEEYVTTICSLEENHHKQL